MIRRTTVVEQAGAGAQFVEPLLRPRQVIGFIAGRCLKTLLHQVVGGRERLPLIKRLSTDFAHMVDAHQGPGERFFSGRQLRHPG